MGLPAGSRLDLLSEEVEDLRPSAPGEKNVGTELLCCRAGPEAASCTAVGGSLAQPQPDSPRHASTFPSFHPFPYPGLVILGTRVYLQRTAQVVTVTSLCGDLLPAPGGVGGFLGVNAFLSC